LALAAYNAGPGNVAHWVEKAEPPPGSPCWVETLLYGETRDYLQAVLFNQVVYHLRLEGHAVRLAQVFRQERPAGGQAANGRNALALLAASPRPASP
ncbi:MAG TPA: hypothetical protein VKA32_08870, partial [Gammaproteobacteria bacterium]|nr:hypothetical protein [Gammaproteobacteria bacterium]